MINDELIGTWCVIPSPEVTSIICKAGFDFVIVDMEHGSMDYTLAQRMVTSAEAEGSKAFIRTSRNDESNILRSLDIGSSGIIVPHVKSVGDVEQCVKYSKYPPIGNRGYTPYTKSGGYCIDKNYQTHQNKNSFVGIILEDELGLKNIETIIDNENINMVYIGTYDISSSMGCLPNDKKVLNELERCTKIIRKAGKYAGCLFHNEDELSFFKNIGINFLVYSVDSGILFNSIYNVKNWSV